MPVASELLVKIGADTREAESGIDRVDGKIGKLAGGAGAMASVASAAFLGLGAAAVGMGAGIASSIGAATAFEQGIAGVGALVGATEAQMLQLSAAALALGQDITLSGVGATDAAAAMEALATAGFSVDQMTGGATRGVLLLASATGTDVTQAATIAGDAFNAFRQAMGLTAQDMPGIANLFVGAANVSSIGLADIGNSMKYIGPIAASMGIDITSVTAAIAALGNQGIKGSEAGTALRTVLASISDPSKEAAATIKQLGLNFFDSTGKVKDFAGISEELKTKLAGLSDQQRATALSTIFGREALAAATVLYGEGAAGIQGYIKAIQEQGDAAAIGARRNATLRGAVESLKGAWETAQIALGQAFLPALASLAQWAARAVSAAIPLIQAWGPRLTAAISSALGVVRQFVGYIASAATALLDAWQKLRGGEITLAQFIGGVKQMIATVVGDLGGLAGRAGQALAGFGGALLGAIRAAAPVVIGELAILGAHFGAWVTGTAIPFLQANLPIWLAALGGWLTGTAQPAVAGWLVGVGTAFGEWVSGTAVPYLQTNLPLWLAALQGWLTGTALPAIVGFLTPLAERFGDWASKAIPYLAEHLPLWLASLVGWWYGTALPTAAGFLLELGQKFGTWVGETAVPWLKDHLPKWTIALGDWLRNEVIPAAVSGLRQVGEKFGTWVTADAVPFLQQHIPEWLTALKDWLTGTAIPAIVTALITVGQKFGDWVTETAVPWLQGKIPQWKDAIVNYLRDTALPAVQATATNLGKGLVEFFMAEATTLKDKAAEEMGKVPGRIRDALGDLTSTLYQAGRDLVQGFINGILSLIGSIPSIPVPDLPGLPGRAAGGPIAPGQLYVVGERGPELFMSAQAGRIIPNGAARSFLGPTRAVAAIDGGGGGGGRVVHLSVNYYDQSLQGTDRARLAEFARDLKGELDRLVG